MLTIRLINCNYRVVETTITTRMDVLYEHPLLRSMLNIVPISVQLSGFTYDGAGILADLNPAAVM